MLITVYVPTKNRVLLLERAVQSVLKQSHQDLELIVVDDGSTDTTWEMLGRIVQQDARVRRVYQSPSRGATVARNTAIRLARGQFLTGLDDDDAFTPDRLERFAQAWDGLARRGERPACLFSNQQILRHGEVTLVTDKPARVHHADLFRFNEIGNQVFAPRQHFIDAGMFREDQPAWQDLDFFLRLLARHGDAVLVPEATYLWDDSPRTDRISRTHEAKLRRACEMVCEAHCPADPMRRQQLSLQLFGKYYGLKPHGADWRTLLRPQFDLRSALRLLRNRFA